MRRTAGFVGLLVALLVALPSAPAHASAAPRGPQTICVHVHASITPRPAHIGDEMILYALWENCGRSAYMLFVFAVHAPARCQGWALHDEYHLRLRKGEGIGDATGGHVDCAGAYRVTGKAYHGGKLIGRATRWIRVLP